MTKYADPIEKVRWLKRCKFGVYIPPADDQRWKSLNKLQLDR